MSPLEHPDAQALPADAVVTPDEVRGCQDRIMSSLGSRSWSVCAPGGNPRP